MTTQTRRATASRELSPSIDESTALPQPIASTDQFNLDAETEAEPDVFDEEEEDADDEEYEEDEAERKR